MLHLCTTTFAYPLIDVKSLNGKNNNQRNKYILPWLKYLLAQPYYLLEKGQPTAIPHERLEERDDDLVKCLLGFIMMLFGLVWFLSLQSIRKRD